MMDNADHAVAFAKMTEDSARRIAPIVEEAFYAAMVEALGEEKAKMYSEAGGDDAFGEFLADSKTDSYIILIDDSESGVAILKEFSENAYSLELFSISPRHSGGGLGAKVWHSLEKLYPNAAVFETTTPTFAIKNVNFYVNKCKFHIIELLDSAKTAKNHGDTDPYENAPDFRYNFRFQKKMY